MNKQERLIKVEAEEAIGKALVLQRRERCLSHLPGYKEFMVPNTGARGPSSEIPSKVQAAYCAGPLWRMLWKLGGWPVGGHLRRTEGPETVLLP